MIPSKSISPQVHNTRRVLAKKNAGKDPSSQEATVPPSLPEEDGELQEYRQLEKQFRSALSRQQLPDALLDELFEWSWETAVRGNRPDFMGDIADLFAMQYDDNADPLKTEDWQNVSELAGEYDSDLDIQLLEYIMMQVVEHHGLD